MSQVRLSVCIVVYLLTGVETARILAIFPMPAHSHQVEFQPFTQELAKSHQVVVVTPEPVFHHGKEDEKRIEESGEGSGNLTVIDLHDDIHKTFNAVLTELLKEKRFDLISGLHNLARELFLAFNKNRKIIKLLEERFDLLFIEGCMTPLLGLTHKLKIPVILISSFGSTTDNYEIIGAPLHPMLYPTYSRRKIYNTTIWEELIELYNYAALVNFRKKQDKINDQIFKSNNIPTTNELKNDVDMIFLNFYSILDNNQPVPPGVVYYGGSREITAKMLPENLKLFMDSSTAGVIYSSFGTGVRPEYLEPHVVPTLMRAFSRLPYNILMKWPEEIPGRSRNVRIEKWLPQVDVLGHPNTKLFITQAGLQSSMEALVSGVPLIGIPVWYDQFFNTEKYLYFGIGERLDLEALTETELVETILKVLSNHERYQRNMARLRSLLNDQPIPPLQRAIFWTEHVLKHGSKHLRAPAANMTWTEFYEVEILFIFLLFFITCLVIVAKFVNLIFRYFSRLYQRNYYQVYKMK